MNDVGICFALQTSLTLSGGKAYQRRQHEMYYICMYVYLFVCEEKDKASFSLVVHLRL